MSDYPENLVPIATPETQTDPRQATNLTAHEALQFAGGVARRRGAIFVAVTLADGLGVEQPHGAEWSAAEDFRIQVIAEFKAGHRVVGQTNPIPRAEYFEYVDDRHADWQIIACQNLIEQFLPLHPSEVHDHV